MLAYPFKNFVFDYHEPFGHNGITKDSIAKHLSNDFVTTDDVLNYFIEDTNKEHIMVVKRGIEIFLNENLFTIKHFLPINSSIPIIHYSKTPLYDYFSFNLYGNCLEKFVTNLLKQNKTYVKNFYILFLHLKKNLNKENRFLFFTCNNFYNFYVENKNKENFLEEFLLKYNIQDNTQKINSFEKKADSIANFFEYSVLKMFNYFSSKVMEDLPVNKNCFIEIEEQSHPLGIKYKNKTTGLSLYNYLLSYLCRHYNVDNKDELKVVLETITYQKLFAKVKPVLLSKVKEYPFLKALLFFGNFCNQEYFNEKILFDISNEIKSNQIATNEEEMFTSLLSLVKTQLSEIVTSTGSFLELQEKEKILSDIYQQKSMKSLTLSICSDKLPQNNFNKYLKMFDPPTEISMIQVFKKLKTSLKSHNSNNNILKILTFSSCASTKTNSDEEVIKILLSYNVKNYFNINYFIQLLNR